MFSDEFMAKLDELIEALQENADVISDLQVSIEELGESLQKYGDE